MLVSVTATMPESIRRLFTLPPLSVSVGEIDRALDNLNRERQVSGLRLAKLQREAAEVQEQMEAVRSWANEIAAYGELARRLQGIPASPTDEAPEQHPRQDGDARRAPVRRGAKKDAIISILREGEQDVETIARAMAARGLMTAESKSDLHALQVALSRMVQRDEIYRPRPKVYRLASGQQLLETTEDD